MVKSMRMAPGHPVSGGGDPGAFRVWAPAARQVSVVIGTQAFPMFEAGGGWWFLESEQARHGTDYAFILDGSEPLPDPRSMWQPHGVHGFSRVLDHTRFQWTDSRWQPQPLSGAVIYELHTGTFSPEGTFRGVKSRLDYLAELGITHVELMPVASFPGRHGWGYDGVDLFAPHEPYGGPEQLKELIDACHARGLAVILDVVYNHLGPDGNYLGRFGPYFTQRYTSPWGMAVNFDGPGSDEVRRFFIDNALMWMRDYHIDALRLDAVHAMMDTSAVHFLRELSEEVEQLEAGLGRSLALIAESNLNDPRIVEPREIGGYGIHAQWSDDLHHALHALLTGERQGYYMDFGTLADLACALEEVFVLSGRYSTYRGRRHGRPARHLSGHRFIGCLQNHDQVGNRAAGERIGHLAGTHKLMIGSALVLTSPCIPMIFQGEEWAASSPFQYFTDHQDPELGRAVAKGRIEEFAAFGWDPGDIPDPQAASTFERSRLDWDERTREPHASVLSWYRALIRLRRSLPALNDGRPGRTRVRFHESEGWLVMQRRNVTVACNFSGQHRSIELPGEEEREVLIASRQGAALRGSLLMLPAESAVVLSIRAKGLPCP